MREHWKTIIEEAKMFARHVIASVKKEKVDEALKIYQEVIVPAGKTRKGYRGIYLLTDRQAGKIISISLWDSPEDAAAIEEGDGFQAPSKYFSELLETHPVNGDFEVSMMLAKAK